MYKILFGIPAMFPPKEAVNKNGFIEDYEVTDPDVDIWCDFSVGYNCEENYYYLEFETMLGFENKEDCRNWIVTCYEEFTSYMKRHGYSTDKELSLYQVFTEGINVNDEFATIEDAYAFVKFVVNGFHGEALFYSQENNRDNSTR